MWIVYDVMPVWHTLEVYINVLWVMQTILCLLYQLRFPYLAAQDSKLPKYSYSSYSFQVNNFLYIYLDLNLFSKLSITSMIFSFIFIGFSFLCIPIKLLNLISECSISECSGYRVKLNCNYSLLSFYKRQFTIVNWQSTILIVSIKTPFLRQKVPELPLSKLLLGINFIRKLNFAHRIGTQKESLLYQRRKPY